MLPALATQRLDRLWFCDVIAGFEVTHNSFQGLTYSSPSNMPASRRKAVREQGRRNSTKPSKGLRAGVISKSRSRYYHPPLVRSPPLIPSHSVTLNFLFISDSTRTKFGILHLVHHINILQVLVCCEICLW